MVRPVQRFNPDERFLDRQFLGVDFLRLANDARNCAQASGDPD